MENGEKDKDVKSEVERWKDIWMKAWTGPQTLQHCLSFV